MAPQLAGTAEVRRCAAACGGWLRQRAHAESETAASVAALPAGGPGEAQDAAQEPSSVVSRSARSSRSDDNWPLVVGAEAVSSGSSGAGRRAGQPDGPP